MHRRVGGTGGLDAQEAAGTMFNTATSKTSKIPAAAARATSLSPARQRAGRRAAVAEAELAAKEAVFKEQVDTEALGMTEQVLDPSTPLSTFQTFGQSTVCAK
jgi:hypothetical protein